MGVVVVRNPAHVVVDVAVDGQLIRRHPNQLILHVRQLVGRRRFPVLAPNDHRYEADLAVGNPADLVFMEPFCEPGSLAELAVGNTMLRVDGERVTHKVESKPRHRPAETNGGIITIASNGHSPGGNPNAT